MNTENNFEMEDGIAKTNDRNMYRIHGLNPTKKTCDFSIYLNRSFARTLESLEVPNQQNNVSESLCDMMLENMMSNIRFHEDSFLITNITVGGDATGIDLLDKNKGRYEYCTHNVDVPQEAVEVISVFSYWVELAHHVLDSELEE